MALVPLPSHIHYELLLQLLERQTLLAIEPSSPLYPQVQEMIIHLRKALVCQKQLEASCACANLTVEHRWSLNNHSLPERIPPDLLAPNVSQPHSQSS